ncbi:TonB-dependent receptor [Aromatoleum aromaticum]|uniref:TonB-dependent receptor n=1 Tax=Aromatoleum aromaticum (strain DSM 19018 / LMG 30748 / EbN1) TaxID=76114 RepID=Q5P0K7_AROAE|nr:TonB-dependent siderophore receptor [Aromatoleum aromaticum]NMG55749.1 TonB-dependent siderophore receptor [Aromatoleum aromaticum]CAI09157.1 putative TonB-dependent receptor [Aromatoleum aromaticum EbN1]
MSFKIRMKPAAVAVFAALGGAHVAVHAADAVLAPVLVKGEAERADGPVQGYRATRSATFTKTDTPLKEVPASITVVPGEVIQDQAMRGMSDVLRYVPGVTAAQGEGNRDQMVIRGNNTTADFFVNGIRDDAQIFRDVYNLERVEVLKGPGGMTFGRGGAGGVVNRVTKRPLFGHVGEASLTVGSWDQLRGTVDVGEKINDAAAWRLNAMAEKANSFRDGVDLDRYGINPTITFTPGGNTALTLGFEHFRDERTADRGVPSQNGRPFDDSRSRFFGNADQSESRTGVDALTAVIEHDFGGVQLRNSFRAAQYDKFYQNVFSSNVAINPARQATLSAYNNSNDRLNVFNQTDLTTKFATGGLQHTLLAGIELGYQDSDNRRKTGQFAPGTNVVPASNPFGTAISFNPTATDANNNVESDTYAVYVQDQIALNEQWKVLAGLRYDKFEVDFNDKRAANTDLSTTDEEVSPRFGLIWTPTARQTYYASYSYSFLPAGEQLSLSPNTEDLNPEKAINYEVGARWDVLPELTLSTAVFRLDREDVRAADPLNPGFFVQTGEQRTEGFEIGLQGQVTPWWQVFAGYANLDAEITKTSASAPKGRKVGLVPDHMTSIWNRFDLGQGWGVGLGVINQSSSYTSFTNSVKLPSFTRVDGAVYYTFNDRKTRLALNVENITDKEYFPTAHSDNNISPGAPLNARLTLSTAF